jgi:hypothetical protein
MRSAVGPDFLSMRALGDNGAVILKIVERETTLFREVRARGSDAHQVKKTLSNLAQRLVADIGRSNGMKQTKRILTIWLAVLLAMVAAVSAAEARPHSNSPFGVNHKSSKYGQKNHGDSHNMSTIITAVATDIAMTI